MQTESIDWQRRMLNMRARTSSVGQLSLMGMVLLAIVVAFSWLVAASTMGQPLSRFGGVVLIVCSGWAVLRYAVGLIMAEMPGLRSSLADLAADAAAQESHLRAQNSLDSNLDLLRETLYGYGEPKQSGGCLFFGNRQINGDFEAVDQVKARFGGSATVFLGDERVATNVQSPDGSRAIGTRLAPGKTRDIVLGEGKVFLGETQVLGQPHFTIYEPIVSDGRVIGILYVGVKKVVDQPTAAPDKTVDTLSAMVTSVESIRKAMHAQAEAGKQAVAQRQSADNARRRSEIGRQAAGVIQRRAIASLTNGLERLAGGDLMFRLEDPFTTEYEKLRIDFNCAIDKLRETISVVASTAESIRLGTEEITQAADDLSHRTERQAATLEQTATALNQITATVKRTAEGAAVARQIVSTAKTNSGHMSQIVGSAVEAMNRIDKSSDEIAQIISIIDEIAFQTNLLALNAGVEAARAGESGRGFAVVASEVRALAQRSASAAKEIKTLITDSTQQVEQGVALVAETGSALDQLVSHVGEIDGIVSKIAASAQEQAAGLQQVNMAVNQMDQVTQQNAAMVEQSTAASRILADDTHSLSDLIARFALEERVSRGAENHPKRQAHHRSTIVPIKVPRRSAARIAS
jgi:methyl-accepting chemotaxis protein